MSKTLRVGIVGMGIGRENARGILSDPRGCISALCDLLPDRMDAVASDLRLDAVKKFRDYRAMCRDKDVDAVFVGTPNDQHAPVALEAIRRGKHVLVTKPLADSERSAARLVAAQEKAGVVGMMSLSTRFDGPCRYLGHRARAGEFGSVYYARARSIRRSGIPDWNLGFINAGGGALRDMGVHVLDAAWWLLGMPEPVSVSGVAGAQFGPRGAGFWDFRTPPAKFFRQYACDDYAGGFIRFDNGAGLQLESFWASHQPEDFQIELFGARAGARINPLTVYRTDGGAPVDQTIRIPKGPSVWNRLASHFIACALDGVPCEAPLRHGLIVQRMMEAFLRSAREGREVRV